MPASFLHGVEVIEVTTGPNPVSIVKSAVIGLIGTAPSWAVAAPAAAPAPNTPTLVSSALAAANFGPLVQGYSIPYALAAIQAQGAGQAIVINVFDPGRHTTAITAQPLSFPASGVQALNLGHMGVSNVIVKNQAGTTTYVSGTDYSLDAVNGVITALTGGALTAGEAVSVSFNYADPTKVADADIIGAVTAGVYTGIQALQTTYGTMGFFAKLLIAPGFSQNADVATALAAMANTIRAMALVDSAPSTPVASAISNRGAAGNAFDTSSTRVILCYPQEQFYDAGLVPTAVTLSTVGTPVTTPFAGTSVGPYSQWVAGAIAAKDLAHGYWWSPSNTEVTGILGPDVSVYASILDPLSDVNNLNAQGIATVFNAFGTGLRVWGNRSAAYPSITSPANFINVRRTMDVIEESIQLSMLQFIDQPISNALITAILASVNAFIRSLIQRGALVAGSASYNPAENPPSQVAAGQLVFDVDVMPPPPAERITFQSYIDSSLLAQLGQTSPLTAAAGATA
ncbi:MAG TPA: phage tail sheath subtilisin-like domain-containing protein [Candidatus Binataceae bacterium]|nr:phage tail sheath subtilisin-like domain-containing protein [Candidatus Binataceae bacterium]